MKTLPRVSAASHHISYTTIRFHFNFIQSNFNLKNTEAEAEPQPVRAQEKSGDVRREVRSEKETCKEAVACTGSRRETGNSLQQPGEKMDRSYL